MSGTRRDGGLAEVVDGRQPPPAEGTFALPVETWARLPRTLDGLLSIPGVQLAHDGDYRGRLVDVCQEIQARFPDPSRLRFAEKEWGLPWYLLAWMDDGLLGGDPRGEYGLAHDVLGMGLDLSWLTRDQQVVLLALLYLNRSGADRDHTRAEDALQKALLACCPRILSVPPIDLDANDKATGWTAAEAISMADRFAGRLAQGAEAAGLGRPFVYRTNARKGSIHLDFMAPEGFSSAYLVEAWAALVVPFLARMGVPYSGEYTDVPVQARPFVVADTTVFSRTAESRGVLWRAPGSAKRPDAGQARQPKSLIQDLAHPDRLTVPPPQARDWSGRTVSRDLLEQALAAVLAKDVRVRARRESLCRAVDDLLQGRLAEERRPAARPRETSLPAQGETQAPAAPFAPSQAERPVRRFRTEEDAMRTLLPELRALPATPEARAAMGEALGGFLRPSLAVAMASQVEVPREALRPPSTADGTSSGAWSRWRQAMGDQQALAMVQALALSDMEERATDTWLRPTWASEIRACMRAGGWPLGPEDVPDDLLRRALLADYRTLSAWFRVTGDRSTDEWRFLSTAHDRQLLSKEEAVQLAWVKPGGKSREDPRGAAWARREADKIEERDQHHRQFGPGVTGREVDLSSWVAPRRERTESAGEQDGGDDEGPLRLRRVLPPHVANLAMGEGPLPTVAHELQASRDEIVGWGQVVVAEERSARSRRHLVEAVSAWLLSAGAPRAAVQATLVQAGVSLDPEEARRSVERVVSTMEARQPVLSLEWIRAGSRPAAQRLQAALEAHVQARQEEARAQLVAAIRQEDQEERRRQEVARAVDPAAGQVPDPLRNVAPPGAPGPVGSSPPAQPDAGPPTSSSRSGFCHAVSGWVGAALARAPAAAVHTAMALLAAYGVPTPVVAETFRRAGMPQYANAERAIEANARVWPAPLRARLEREAGRRTHALVSAIEQDAWHNTAGLPQPVRASVLAAVATRRSYAPHERSFLSRVNSVHQPFAARMARGQARPQAVAALVAQSESAKKALADVAKCGLYRNDRTCPTHGDQGTSHISIGRALPCRHCRTQEIEGIIEGIRQANWGPRVCMARIDVPFWHASSLEDLAMRAFRMDPDALRELSVLAAKTKAARWADVRDRISDPAPAQPGEQAQPQDDEEQTSRWADAILRILPSDDPPEAYLRNRPVRFVFMPTGFYVFMPERDGEAGEWSSRLLAHYVEWHRRIGRTVTMPTPPREGCSPREREDRLNVLFSVPFDQALAEVRRALEATGELMDVLVRSRVQFMTVADWLRPNQKRTTSTGKGKRALHWPNAEEARLAAIKARESKLTPEQQAVEKGRCRALLPQDPVQPPTVARQPCRTTLTVTCRHSTTEAVLLQNNAGIDYDFEQAEQARQALGVPEFLLAEDG